MNIIDNMKLILDPGHGGIDPGAIAIGGMTEKEFNLRVCEYMKRRFNEIGIVTGITREKDVTLESDERTDIVVESGAEYCLSVHFNAGGGDGFEAIHSIYASDDLAETIAHYVREIGQNVRRVFTRTYPGNDALDYYYMNRETGSTQTTILEGFFGDNWKDYKDFDTWQEQKELAEAYIEGFCHYIGVDYEPPKVSENMPSGLWKVQTGAFSSRKNAEQLASRLQKDGYNTYITKG